MTIDNYRKKFFAAELVGILFGTPVAGAYSILSTNINPEKVILVVVTISIVLLIIVLFIALPTNLYLFHSLKKPLDDYLNQRLGNRSEIRKLFLKLSSIPFKYSSFMVFRITLGAVISALIMITVLEINLLQTVFAAILAFYGAYIAGIISYNILAMINKPVLQQMVLNKQVSENIFSNRKKNFSGFSFIQKGFFYMIFPLFMTSISIVFSIYSSSLMNLNYHDLMMKIIGVTVVNFLTIVSSISLILITSDHHLKNLNRSLEKINQKKIREINQIPTDLSDDLSYIAYLVNISIKRFILLLNKLNETTGQLSTSIEEINLNTGEVSTASNQQSGSVKEIVSSMEDANRLSHEIKNNILEVANVSVETKNKVNKGFDFIQNNREQMESIKSHNRNTIDGIRNLNEQMKGIWEIINVINNIADQTKIIAFNAELEASNAGDSGRNFEIVATEIRRLADHTVNSVKEIRNQINTIQNSADQLIISSENETANIEKGWNISLNLENVFSEIQDSSDISSSSSNKIAESAKQQADGFQQVLNTLKQYSKGIHQIADAMNRNYRTAEELKKLSDNLNKLLQ